MSDYRINPFFRYSMIPRFPWGESPLWLSIKLKMGKIGEGTFTPIGKRLRQIPVN
jgi:hypothetical protein